MAAGGNHPRRGQHPPVFPASLKAFDELIEDPFTPAQGST
jgi:hypothetical protein